MANTYFGLGTVTVSDSTTQTVSWSGIPATYTDLVIIGTARSRVAATFDDIFIRVNGNTGNNYSSTRVNIVGGTTVSATRITSVGRIQMTAINGANSTSASFSNLEIYFGKYSDTSRAKTVSWYSNGPSYTVTQSWSAFGGGQYGQINSDFSAISSIQLFLTGGYYEIGSTLGLYGIS